MTRSLSRLMPLVSAALLVGACAATLRVHSYEPTGSDIRRYRTYTIAAPGRQSTGDPRLDDNRFFNERVQQNIELQLGSRGFQKASGPADLIVHYHASVAQQLELNDAPRPDCYWPNANGTGRAPSNNCRPYVYDAGTLLVDMVDRRTDKVVWRGWAEGSIDGVLENQEFMEQRVDEAVKRIMNQLPARSAASPSSARVNAP